MIYVWFAILVAFSCIGILPFIYWFKDELYITNMEFKLKTKVILSILAVILYIALIVYSVQLDISTEPNSVVSITEISEVYKSSAGSQVSSYYYISKEGNDELYEIKTNKISEGDSNYVITRKYSDGSISNELILKNKQSIKNLPNFNK